MDTNTKYRSIRRSKSLAGASRRTTRALAEVCDVVDIDTGTAIARAGQAVDNAYVILEGSAQFSIDGQPRCIVKQADVVGALGAYGMRRFSGELTAMEPTALLVIPNRHVLALAERVPAVAVAATADLRRKMTEPACTPRTVATLTRS